MVNDAELERGGRLLGVISDDLGHRLGEEPAQRVDRALTGGQCRLDFLGTHHPDPTDMPKAATKEAGGAGGETNPSPPGFWEMQVSHNAYRSIVLQCLLTPGPGAIMRHFRARRSHPQPAG